MKKKNILIKILDSILKFFKIIAHIITKITNFINHSRIKLSKDQTMKIIQIERNINTREKIYHLLNDNLYKHEEAIRAIYNTLMSNEDFIKFGFSKVIIAFANFEGRMISYHTNVLLSNDTSFEDYYNSVVNHIQIYFLESETIVDSGMYTDVIPYYIIRVWDMDNYSNKNIKITKNISTQPNMSANFINSKINKKFFSTFTNINRSRKKFIEAIPKYNLPNKLNIISAMDVETIILNDTHIPIAISIAYDSNKSKLFLIDYDLIKLDIDKALIKLWEEFFEFLLKNNKFFKYIFVHNLGSFDGYLIFNNLSKILPNNFKAIIDDKNKFILITFQWKNKVIFKWLDSYRIFPVSLDNLCTNFEVEGKTSKYNQKYNDINLFKDLELLEEFKSYSLQDSVGLLKALIKAQKIYYDNYKVDISSILSCSTLSLKIYRSNFQKDDIAILPIHIDKFIRSGYLGGATDYYKAYGKNLHYYDVNSLYPLAMVKDMPFKMIKYHHNMSNVNLEEFFGFCLAEIECPKNIKIPLLPHKYQDRTIYPTGKWIGVYFSEELKAVLPHGYKINLIKGYQFSKINLFKKYVEHFYLLKKNYKNPADRLIAKMHLNQMYGIFGRKQELLETITIKNINIKNMLTKYIIKNIITINDEYSVLLVIINKNNDIIAKLNSLFETEFSSNSEYNKGPIPSNVSIAAAVTSYARIHMIKYKLKYDIFYTDTDSIFTSDKLPDFELGSDLGLMKDELKGKVISEAYFLGIKQYGYYYYDENKKKEKSVFAGITRDSISFKEIESIFRGQVLEQTNEKRFYKSFNNLNIVIKSSKIRIKNNPSKILINNNYLPLNIYDLNHELDNRTMFEKLKNKIIKFFKKILKRSV
jgi:hypothetical protein